ncbi:hypothetical protein TSUD_32930 [Trifolium subterraneum]|uniref:Uncharacterized protein n=1 Tax=Trifolium subterraneum TaxID=3900 RepID=A0A2Z6LPK7_TRISU|nr:hypothetical protein TSUD_32930 [Trifolium subterraneum]
MCIPNIALAASGGRMGGSFFSPSSKSSSSPLDSYSVPTRSRGFSYSASPEGSSFSSSSKSSSCSSSSSQGFSYSAPFNGSSSSSDSYSVPTRSKGYSGEVYVRPTNTDEFDDFYGFLVLIFSVVYWSFYFLVLKVPGFILISIINKKYYCNKYLLVFLVLSLVCGYLFQSSSEEKPPSLNVSVTFNNF